MAGRNDNTLITCYCIDDEYDAVEGLKIVLQKTAMVYVLGVETDPDKAVQDILCLKPEIVFVDIEMGNITGFDLIEMVRKKHYNPSFVFVTAYDYYSIKAIKASVFDYLLKPIDIDELKKTIKRYHSVKPLDTLYLEKQVSFDLLSNREYDIVQLLVKGQSSEDIAKKLYISKHTVDTHRRNILKKTSLNSTAELIKYFLLLNRN